MIDEIRTYIATCPYLDEYTAINVDYLEDKIKSYSINETASYNPIIEEFITGGKNCKFMFSFDSKLHWNSETTNNIDNSKFFEDFKTWLETNNLKGTLPNISGAYKISALTDGYVYATNSDEAIYRIQCELDYYKEN
jgi:hypothetical protein